MTDAATVAGLPAAPSKLEKKPVKFSNLLLGAGLNLFEYAQNDKLYYLGTITNGSAQGYNSGTAT
ncbi:mitochondrial DNA replication protein YHM2 [Paraphaeosphaeria minitans]|uniref:Mitochondrial DNA replication protein YHM2 n=1 Tax=Paraphaeosphaeria minitans TaxID=565426 RepID=A0A9P6GB45_9PLEO|nr:mitochondrial DNA replication protein YHM2 [Paraphaeosphaeria minitans]